MIETDKIITYLTERREDFQTELEDIIAELDNQEQLLNVLLAKSEEYEQKINLIRPFIIERVSD